VVYNELDFGTCKANGWVAREMPKPQEIETNIISIKRKPGRPKRMSK